MPTPFEERQKVEGRRHNGNWAARSDTPRRSVFGNYCPKEEGLDTVLPPHEPHPLIASFSPSGGEGARRADEGDPSVQTLQAAIDTAVARSFLYRFLAKAYEDPTEEGWHWLCDGATQESLRSTWSVLAQSRAKISPVPDRLEACPTFSAGAFDSFLSAYLAAFGHAARGRCPLNEIEYGDLKADPLFQPHRLADLAAFYRAFGLEVSPDADERHDHLCLELEFLCVLAAKDAYALEHQLGADELVVCRDAQKKFLREHLGRWTTAFTRRLAAVTDDPLLRSLAHFTRAFIEYECARFAVAPGSEDLRLRPVNESDERLCASCGLSALPPGASATTET